MIGAAQVAVFNVWTADYLGLLTVIGWVALLKGAIRMAIPSTVVSLRRLVLNANWINPPILVSFVLGAYLLYVGFFV